MNKLTRKFQKVKDREKRVQAKMQRKRLAKVKKDKEERNQANEEREVQKKVNIATKATFVNSGNHIDSDEAKKNLNNNFAILKALEEEYNKKPDEQK